MLSSFAEAQRKASARARSSGKGGKKRQSGPAEQLDWVKRFKAAEQNDSVAKKAAAATTQPSLRALVRQQPLQLAPAGDSIARFFSNSATAALVLAASYSTCST